MDINKLQENIAHAARVRDQKEQDATAKWWEEFDRLVSDIQALLPRLKGLFIVADTLYRHQFNLGPLVGYPFKHPMFQSEGINHRIGFIGKGGIDNHPFQPTGIGIVNGGACGGKDLFIDREGKIDMSQLNWYNNAEVLKYTMKRFLNGFDEFEKDFYEWANNPE